MVDVGNDTYLYRWKKMIGPIDEEGFVYVTALTYTPRIALDLLKATSSRGNWGDRHYRNEHG